MTTATRESAWAAVHDPSTSAEGLAVIAASHAEFANAIARHPNAYPALIAWAASQKTAEPAASVESAQAASPARRNARLGRMLWLAFGVAFVGLPVLLQLFGWIGTIVDSREYSWQYEAMDFWWYAGIPFLPPASILLLLLGALAVTAAVLTAPTLGRRIGAIVLIVVPLLFLIAIGTRGGWSSWLWPLSDRWTLATMLLLVLVWTFLFSAWGVGRPLRGAGWAALPIVAVLPFLLGAFVWPFVRLWLGGSTTSGWEFSGFVTALVGSVVIPGSGVLLARTWSAASERRRSQRAEQPVGASSTPGIAAASDRTNLPAILSLVFAFFISILAVIFGHLALSQIRRTGEQGRGLAIAGLVLGYIGIVTGIILAVFYGAALMALLSYSSY